MARSSPWRSLPGTRSSWRNGDRNARLRLLNTVYRNLAGDNVTVYTHLIRHADAQSHAAGNFRSGFAAALDAAYRGTVLANSLFTNDYFVTLVVSPRSVLGTGFGKFRSKLGRNFPKVADGLARELEDQWHILANGLESFSLRRLGVYEQHVVV